MVEQLKFRVKWKLYVIPWPEIKMVSMVQFTIGHFGSVRSVHENVDSINVELETARICKTSSFITGRVAIGHL